MSSKKIQWKEQPKPKQPQPQPDSTQHQIIKHKPIDFNTHKTIYCTEEDTHPITQAPYYYECNKYHNWQDHRRCPYSDAMCTKLAYNEIYFGDNFSNENCLNWIEYQYHPLNYKSVTCLRNLECNLTYCPKYHSNEDNTVHENRRIPHLSIGRKNSITEDTSQYYKDLHASITQLKRIKDNFRTGTAQSAQIQKRAEDVQVNVQKIKDKLDRVQQKQKERKSELQETIKNLAMKQDISVVVRPEVIGVGVDRQHQQVVRHQGGEKVVFHYLERKVTFENGFNTFIRNQQLHLIEDRHNQFKMFKDKEPRSIATMVLEYISAFLNSEGGNIYLGINDNSYVQGLEVSQKWIDQFMAAIDQEGKIQLSPPLIPQKYRMRVLPVLNNRGYWLNVIEIQVYPQPSQHKTLTLFNRECYLRMNSSNHRLAASEIIQYMRLNSMSKSLTDNINIFESGIDKMNPTQLRDLQQNLNKIQHKISTSLGGK